MQKAAKIFLSEFLVDFNKWNKYTHENSANTAVRLLYITALGQHNGQINGIGASELSVRHQ